MVNLSTKSFPGAHILVGARKVRVNASKKGRRPVLGRAGAYNYGTVRNSRSTQK